MRDKREKFVELAEKRVSRALQMIRLIGNLANRSNYDYTEEEQAKILAALEVEVKRVRGRFATETAKKVEKFKL